MSILLNIWIQYILMCDLYYLWDVIVITPHEKAYSSQTECFMYIEGSKLRLAPGQLENFYWQVPETFNTTDDTVLLMSDRC